MKRLLFLSTILIIIVSHVSAQRNILENGNFDEQGKWKVVQGVVDEPVNVEFGSTDYWVEGGDGPNLLLTHVTVNEEQVFIYQAVELVAEKEYTFSLAINNLSAVDACWWCNLFWSLDEPVDGEDITENKIAGFDAWIPELIPDFNGLLDTFQTSTRTDNIFIPEFDGVHFIGINFGSCSGTGDHVLVFDEMALIDPDLPPVGIETQVSANRNELRFYPNPASTILKINYKLVQSSDVEIILVNLLGQKVVMLNDEFKSVGKHNRSFDCSDLPDGLYYGILRTENATLTRKIVISK